MGTTGSRTGRQILSDLYRVLVGYPGVDTYTSVIPFLLWLPLQLLQSTTVLQLPNYLHPPQKPLLNLQPHRPLPHYPYFHDSHYTTPNFYNRLYTNLKDNHYTTSNCHHSINISITDTFDPEHGFGNKYQNKFAMLFSSHTLTQYLEAVRTVPSSKFLRYEVEEFVWSRIILTIQPTFCSTRRFV